MQSPDNQAIFSQAMITGDVAQVAHFLKEGAVDINQRDVTHDLETPLMSLCHVQWQTPDAIHNILAALQGEELKVNQRDALGRTLAMHACIAGNAAMLEFAIAQGCDVMVTDRKGKNLIHHVAVTGNEVLVNAVLKHPDVGHALRILDSQGYSPVDLARQKRHSAVARQLSSALQQGTRPENGHVTSRHNHQQHTEKSHGYTPQTMSPHTEKTHGCTPQTMSPHTEKTHGYTPQTMSPHTEKTHGYTPRTMSPHTEKAREYTPQTLSPQMPSAPINPSTPTEADHQQSNRVSHGYQWRHTSSEDTPLGDHAGAVTEPPMDRNSQPPHTTRCVNVAAAADHHEHIPLARKESLRRSHIFRKPPEGDSRENDPGALRSKTPLPPCFDPKSSSPAAQRRILSQANRDSQTPSRSSQPGVTDNRTQLVSSVSRSNPSTPKRVLFNNAVLRQSSFDSSGRVSASLSSSSGFPSGQNDARERPKSVLNLQGFLSPRPTPKQVHSRNRVPALRPQDCEDENEARSRTRWSRDKEDDGFGEGVVTGHELHTPHLGHPNTSGQLTELHIKRTKSRHRERRSSISLPDLRDMAGCLVTSNKTETFSNLAAGARSRVTLETFEAGRVADQQRVSARDDDTHQREDNSESDASLDSNFEDESPVRRAETSKDLND